MEEVGDGTTRPVALLLMFLIDLLVVGQVFEDNAQVFRLRNPTQFLFGENEFREGDVF